MGTNRGAIDAVMAAVRHDLGQRDGHRLPDPSIAPTAETPVDRVPVAVFRRDVAPWRAAAKSPKYAVDYGAVLFRPATASPVRRINRQQIFQNTPFCLAQIASAQACLQKAALNQALRFASTNLSTPPSHVYRRQVAVRLTTPQPPMSRSAAELTSMRMIIANALSHRQKLFREIASRQTSAAPTVSRAQDAKIKCMADRNING